MKVSIFSRLVMGYLAVFLLLVVVALYAIVQIGRLHHLTRSVLEMDQRIVENEKKLSDALFSQMQFERKYLIVRDEALLTPFLRARSDFDRHLEEALSLFPSSPLREPLQRAQTYHRRYHELLDEELKRVRGRQNYPVRWFREEKEKALDEILGELEKWRLSGQRHTYNKIKTLEEAGAGARRMALILTVSALLGVLAISFAITRSITRPIAILIEKTREIGRWIFRSDLHLTSPPELGELSRAINRMCDRLQAVDKMKSDFFSTMSHELRTPLSSIKEGTSQLLEGLGGVITAKQKRLLTIIADQSNRLIGLVNSLLDLSKMEAGMVNFLFTPAEPAGLIQEAAVEMEPLALAKGIRLEVELAPGLPAVKVDRERILQVLRNLLGNAVKFTPAGGKVRVTAQDRERRLEVRVQDTGPGIAREHLSIIFEKFQQVPLNSLNPGTGLGLAIAKRIITAHGGKLWAESEPGRGSCFIFVLPD